MATVANMLYNKKQKLLREGELGVFEIRFYSSDTPNEKYRIGQKYLKGRVVSIIKRDSGFGFKIDTSTEYNGTYITFDITDYYIELCHAKCIVFIIDSTTIDGIEQHREISISSDEWLSNNTYITTGIVEPTDEQYPYNVGDIVEFTYTDVKTYKDVSTIAKIRKIQSYTDDNDITYYNIQFDGSGEYLFNQFIVANKYIKAMKLFHKPDIERPWEDY